MAEHGEDIPPIVHALSGAVASIFSNTFVYPLDLITTRLQTQDRKHARDAKTPDKHYDGLADALFRIYEDEGAGSLWQGVVADNVSTMASTFCYHFAYNAIRESRFKVATRRNGGTKPAVLGLVEELSIGATAGVIARFVTAPLSTVVTRSQTHGGSTVEIVKLVYRDKGITGFWSGMKASVILAANPSISYYLFEVQKALLIPKARRDSPRGIEIFLMSATGKAIATLLLYPIILVKARTQALRVKSSIWSLVKSILEKDGLGGLYQGAVPQVLKGFLSQGILMLLKDRIATLIISGYLALSRRKARAPGPGYYFQDAPKTDVNGLIAATKDKVEVAVDDAVDTIKEVVGDAAETVHLEEAMDRAKVMAQSARETSGIAMDKAKEVAQSVAATTNDHLKTLAGVSREKLADGLGAAQSLVAPKPNDAAAGGAMAKGKLDSPEWSSQTRTDLPSTNERPARAVESGKVDSPEWSNQTRTDKDPTKT